MPRFAKSLKQPNLVGLSRDSTQGATNSFQHLIQDIVYRPEPNNFHFIENYLGGKLDIVLEFSVKASPCHFHFVFRAVPSSLGPANGVKVMRNNPSQYRAHGNEGNNNLVLIAIAELVQCPQGIIPSEVWLAVDHDIKNALRDIAGPTFTLRSCNNFIEAIPKREVGMLPSASRCPRDSESSMIQCGTQIVKGVKYNAWNLGGHWLNQLDLENMLTRISIMLDNGFAGICINEVINYPYQLIKASLSMRDAIH